VLYIQSLKISFLLATVDWISIFTTNCTLSTRSSIYCACKKVESTFSKGFWNLVSFMLFNLDC